ncbi:MAG: hypothetical protein DHS80DRAFT_15972 [Piptocephalis tieghemiana]|nr:MAG: hypothetical protein DHS80DRAFT_15972 [Piptocephalis tieghemiana]
MYTENSTDVALIIEDEYSAHFVHPSSSSSPITSYDEVFRALEIEATEASRSAPLITELAAPLARAGISIFYISTYQTDLFLVAESRLDEVVSSLRDQHFTFDDPSSSVTQEDQGDEGSPSPSERRQVRDGHLAMAGLNLEFVDLWAAVVVKVLLYPQLLPERQDQFNEDWLNRSLDAQPLQLIQFSLHGFDKDRHGIVHSVTKPLSAEGIPLLYLSTILTANLLVSVDDAPRALEVLGQESTKHETV